MFNKETTQIICIHSGIVLKQFSGIVEVDQNQTATILEKDKNGVFIIGINGYRCLLHRSQLNQKSFIPENDKFAYFKTIE